MIMPNARRYLIGCAVSAIGIAVALALLMVAVDPYRAFNLLTVPDVNALKPRAGERSSIAKSHIIARLHPRTLLLGNSRVEVSLDPHSPAWPATWQTVVNAAQAGTGLDTALCRLNEAISAGSLERVVLGIDVQDFLFGETPEPSSPLPTVPSSVACERDTGVLKQMISIDGVADSLMTVFGQNPTTGTTMDADGFNPARDNLVHVARIGYRGLFNGKLRSYRESYARAVPSTFGQPERYKAFRALQAILRTTAAHNIQLVIYIHPYHAQYLDMLKGLGLWPTFEAWKRQVTSLVDAANQGRFDPVRLLDFSGYNEVTAEAVPPMGGKDTQWYWEPGHYKQALGDRIIRDIVTLEGKSRSGSAYLPVDLAQQPD